VDGGAAHAETLGDVLLREVLALVQSADLGPIMH
jgi:hypothetical protein